MAAVCFDTMVLIWAAQEHITGPSKLMAEKAQALVDKLTAAKTTIIIPSIVVGEALLKIPDDEVVRFMQRLQRRFMIVPYDFAAARRFASLWLERKNHPEILAQKGVPGSRTMLRADGMIVATALHNRCTAIYTHNEKDLRKFAGNNIELRSVPEISEQNRLL